MVYQHLAQIYNTSNTHKNIFTATMSGEITIHGYRNKIILASSKVRSTVGVEVDQADPVGAVHQCLQSHTSTLSSLSL